MSGVFEYYFTHCLDGFSSIVLLVTVLYVLLSIITGLLKDRKLAYYLLLLGYCLLIIYLTFLSRPATEHVNFSMAPFSSYQAVLDGDLYMVPQIIMNVVVFMPVGFLLSGYFSKWNWKKVIASGALFSIGIELLQFVSHRGTAELDDVIHNTLGCMIGVLVFKGVEGLVD